jgi:hypothetical protein
MVCGKISKGALFVRTAAIAIVLVLLVPGITALGTDRSAYLQAARGGDALIIFQGATTDDFQAVALFIETHGGSAYARNPPNSIRAVLPAGLGTDLLGMQGVRSVSTGPIDANSVKGMNYDVQIAVGAWNMFLQQRSAAGPLGRGVSRPGTPVTSISDRSGGISNGPRFNDGMADIHNDAIVCDEDLFCTADRSKVLQARGPASPMSPAPGLWDTSEYMLGTVGVAIVFPESNGSIDANQETWTVGEKTNVINEITGTFAWWQARETAMGFTIGLSFSYKTYNQSTSYEPITRNGFTGAANQNMWTWMNEILGDLGYSAGFQGAREFANATRGQLGTDWGYIVWVADDTVDGNNQFADNTFGFAGLGGPYVVMTYDNDGYTINSMDAVFAHESGHIFFTLDEYAGAGAGADSSSRSGYENVLNGNSLNVGTPPPMINQDCIMRGGTTAYTNSLVCVYTKGQIGWNDTDNDHIPNVLDTFPNTTLNSMPAKTINKTTYTYYGNASEVPLNNLNPAGAGNDVSINRLTKVEWRLDGGSWGLATATDGSFSSATEGFKFTLIGLTEGSHKVEVKATNNRGNVEPDPANETFLVDLSAPNTQVGPLPQYQTQPSFRVNWTGSDGAGSGLKQAELYYRKDGGAWKRYLTKFITSPITFIHSGDGLYEFYTVGTDNASNLEVPPATPDASTTVEATPPFSSAGPLPAFTNMTTIDVPYTADDLGVGVDKVSLFYKKDNAPWALFGNFTSSPVHFSSIGDGTYYFYSVALDKLANKEDKFPKAEATIIVDTKVPLTNLTIVGVSGENGWYTSNLTVTLYTSEPTKNLDYTKYRLDGGNWTVYKNILKIPGDGVRLLEFYSADKAGNVEALKAKTLKIDLTPPRGSVVLNGGKIQTNSSIVDVVLDAKDGAAPVTQMMVTEDASFAAASWVPYTNHMTYTLTSISGEKFVYAQFKNEAGLVSDVFYSSVIQDGQPPTIAISDPDNGAGLATFQFAVKGTASDNVGLSRVEVSIDGKDWVVANGTTEWDTVLGVKQNGRYNISAVAYDKVGNKASKTIFVDVDATLPTLSGLSPQDGAVSESKNIPIKGRTDPKAVVKVNGVIVTVDKDGNFSYVVSLKEGTNNLVIDIIKPAGTIEKKVRVIYVHPPIIISDLKHRPTDPEPKQNVTISCVVPGTHISQVDLHYKVFGKSELTVKMTHGPSDVYSTVIGPFQEAEKIDYWVSAVDEVNAKGRYPEASTRTFTVASPVGPPVLPPEPKKESNDIYAIIFLIIIFAVFAVGIGLTMRSPKDPYAAKKVTDRTATERIDDRTDEGSGFRESRPAGRPPDRGGRPGQSRYGEPPEADHYDQGDSYSRFKD